MLLVCCIACCNFYTKIGTLEGRLGRGPEISSEIERKTGRGCNCRIVWRVLNSSGGNGAMKIKSKPMGLILMMTLHQFPAAKEYSKMGFADKTRPPPVSIRDIMSLETVILLDSVSEVENFEAGYR